MAGEELRAKRLNASSPLRKFIHLAESAVSEAGEKSGPVLLLPDKICKEFARILSRLRSWQERSSARSA